MAEKCCYTCDNYRNGICQTSDRYDDEDPNTFSCELYEENTDN